VQEGEVGKDGVCIEEQLLTAFITFVCVPWEQHQADLNAPGKLFLMQMNLALILGFGIFCFVQ
jgi:hypothetical protein